MTAVWQFPCWVNQVANFESKLSSVRAQHAALWKMVEMNRTNEEKDDVRGCMLNSEHFPKTGCLVEIGGAPQQTFLNKENIDYWWVVAAHSCEVQQAVAEDVKSSETAQEYWNTAVDLKRHLENIVKMEAALEDVATG